MSLLTEQLSSAAQNQLAKQIAVFQAWSQLAFGGLEKLIALNFNTAKQSLENANSVTHDLLAATQAQELLHLGRSQAQPQFEKILSYGRELAAISIDTRTELWQIVSKQSTAEIVATVAVATPALKAAPAEVTKPVVTKPVVTKPVVTKPAVKKLAAKPIAATKQLTLLAEPEVKPAKAPAKPKAVAKVAEKPVAKVAAKAPAAKAEVKPAVAKPSEVKPETAKPVVAKSSKAAKTEAAKKPLKTSTTTVEAAPAPVPVVTPAEPLPAATTSTIEKTLDKKTTPAKKPAAKTEATETTAATKAATKADSKPADSKPAASTEKKSAVKFPFPATPNLKKAPGFPANNGKPAYKAKSSAATGAKKPVRQ
ncbi:TIGR01841 family phasin [Undibacterium sp. TC4M20W]|uniref:phasin family protein n=1 Tax=unclassified Undibacterium TaxID=2630295 RepID=UPI003BF210A2